MSKISLATAIFVCLLSAPGRAEDQSTYFLTTTISDIGIPYTVIDGDCAYGKATGFDIVSPEFESAFKSAAIRLVADAKAHGGDAIVGMQASPISEAAGDRNGVLVCGTIVKLKK